MRSLYPVLNLVGVMASTKASLERVARVYFILVRELGLDWLRDQVDFYPIDTHWNILARSLFKGDLDRYLHRLAVSVLRVKAPSEPTKALYPTWLKRHASSVETWLNVLADLRTCSTIDVTMLSVAISKLHELVLASA